MEPMFAQGCLLGELSKLYFREVNIFMDQEVSQGTVFNKEELVRMAENAAMVVSLCLVATFFKRGRTFQVHG